MICKENIMLFIIVVQFGSFGNSSDTLSELPPPLPDSNRTEESVLWNSPDDADAKPHESSSRSGVKTCGIIMTSISYGLALTTSIVLNFSDHAMDKRVAKVLWIPLAGPIAADVVDGLDDPSFTLVCAMWSIVEVTGFACIIGGSVQEHKRRAVRLRPALRHRAPGMVCDITF